MLASPTDVWKLPGFLAGEVSAGRGRPDGSPAGGWRRRTYTGCLCRPGGKACHILELQPGLAELVAMDINAARLQKVSENPTAPGSEATLLTGMPATPAQSGASASFGSYSGRRTPARPVVYRAVTDVKPLRRESDCATGRATTKLSAGRCGRC
jgi:16S rRNA (cytosine967-C5)-methyltransferase